MQPNGKMGRFTPSILIALLVHTGLIAIASGARNAAPRHGVTLSPRADGVLVYGRNAFGLTSARLFKDWPTTLAYLESHDLKLPALSYAERSDAESISAEPVEAHYRVKWISRAGRSVLYAPDARSAEVFAEYLRYRRVEPGALGYGLTLAN